MVEGIAAQQKEFYQIPRDVASWIIINDSSLSLLIIIIINIIKIILIIIIIIINHHLRLKAYPGNFSNFIKCCVILELHNDHCLSKTFASSS